jgi:hypothetical protein
VRTMHECPLRIHLLTTHSLEIPVAVHAHRWQGLGACPQTSSASMLGNC